MSYTSEQKTSVQVIINHMKHSPQTAAYAKQFQQMLDANQTLPDSHIEDVLKAVQGEKVGYKSALIALAQRNRYTESAGRLLGATVRMTGNAEAYQSLQVELMRASISPQPVVTPGNVDRAIKQMAIDIAAETHPEIANSLRATRGALVQLRTYAQAEMRGRTFLISLEPLIDFNERKAEHASVLAAKREHVEERSKERTKEREQYAEPHAEVHLPEAHMERAKEHVEMHMPHIHTVHRETVHAPTLNLESEPRVYKPGLKRAVRYVNKDVRAELHYEMEQLSRRALQQSMHHMLFSNAEQHAVSQFTKVESHTNTTHSAKSKRNYAIEHGHVERAPLQKTTPVLRKHVEAKPHVMTKEERIDAIIAERHPEPKTSLGKLDRKAGKVLGVATITVNTAASITAALQGDYDKARQYAGVAAANTVIEAAQSDRVWQALANATGKLVNQKAGKMVQAVGGKIPVVGAVVGVGFGLYNIGNEIYKATQGESNWQKVTSTSLSAVAGVAGGFVGFGAGEALQEGVHWGTKAAFGEKNAAYHCATVDLAITAYEVGKGAVDAHRHIKDPTKQWEPILADLEKKGWGKHVGNGDAKVTRDELSATLAKNGLTLGMLDRDKNGVSGKEISDGLYLQAQLKDLEAKGCGKYVGNGDARIGAGELISTFAKKGVRMESVDKNHDGKFSARELSDALQPIAKAQQQAVAVKRPAPDVGAALQSHLAELEAKGWGKFIGNGDTKIALDEIKNAFAKSGVKLDSIDKNHDGSITGREITDALAPTVVAYNKAHAGRQGR
jgi:hypothetical protein